MPVAAPMTNRQFDKTSLRLLLLEAFYFPLASSINLI
jgi:hypothetical protein